MWIAGLIKRNLRSLILIGTFGRGVITLYYRPGLEYDVRLRELVHLFATQGFRLIDLRQKLSSLGKEGS